MRTLRTRKELKAWREGRRIGFVPTMGALHEGHLSLVRQARADGLDVLVSIFVNPTQFNDPKDLERYPRPLEKDLSLLANEGVAAVYLPDPDEIYADSYRYEIREKEFSRELCGAHRPGHFEGVLTIVMKLFQLTRPERAYFGEKDHQQLTLIKGMAEAFFLDLEVVGVPTVREADGLAMSSRNLLLTPENRERAPRLYRILREAKDAAEARALLEQEGFRVDYVEDRDSRRYAAAFLGEVRLIDNVAL